jgi:hypothetical protein
MKNQSMNSLSTNCLRVTAAVFLRRSLMPVVNHGPSLLRVVQNMSARFAAIMFFLFGAVAAAAAPLTINVVGVGPDGKPLATAVADYRWTVEEDATKLSVPGQPATTANYSFSFHARYMPVVAAGRVGTERSGVTADPDVARLYAQTPPDLDSAKRYYVSIAAEGFQMGGAPVVFSTTGATATVYLNQYALPTAQVSVFAFNDNNPSTAPRICPRRPAWRALPCNCLKLAALMANPAVR